MRKLYFEDMASSRVDKNVKVTVSTAGSAKGVIAENVVAEYCSLADAPSSDARYIYASENYEREAELMEKLWASIKGHAISDDATVGDFADMQRYLGLRAPTPSGMEIISAYCKCNPDALVVVKLGVPGLMANVARYTFQILSEDPKSAWKFGQISAKIGKREYNIPSNLKDLSTIEISPTTSTTVPSLPCVSVTDGKRRGVMLFQLTDAGDLYITYIGQDKAMLGEVSSWFSAQMDKLNFLKGAKIDGNARFLKIGPTTWDDIVLADGIREKIDANIVHMFGMEKIYAANGIPAKRGFVVLGEPGTGKTTLARILANTLTGVTFIWVVPSAVYGSHSIAKIFDLAQTLSPTIVFFEDADVYMAQRGSMEASGGILTEVMNRLDGVVPLSGVVTGISTNRPEILESALINRPGRFDLKIYLGPPDGKGRLKLLTKCLQKVSVNPSDVQKACDDPGMSKMTPCKIEEVVRRATMRAIEHGHYDKTTMKATVSLQDLTEAISEFNGEQTITGDYTANEQARPPRSKRCYGRVVENSDGFSEINESAKAADVRGRIRVLVGDDVDFDDGDYGKPIESITGLRDATAKMLKHPTQLRHGTGIKRGNIDVAIGILDDAGTTMNDIVIALTGDSE